MLVVVPNCESIRSFQQEKNLGLCTVSPSTNTPAQTNRCQIIRPITSPLSLISTPLTPYQPSPITHHPSPVTHHPLKSHGLLNLRNRLGGIQPLRTRPRAIQNSMAPIQTHTIIQGGLALLGALVARIGDPAVGLQQHGGAEVFFAVPPVRRARRRTAGAEDAFVQAVELFAVGG